MEWANITKIKGDIMSFTARQINESNKRYTLILDLIQENDKDIIGMGIDYNKGVMYMIDINHKEIVITYFTNYKELKKEQLDIIKHLKGNS